jgi:hypothetical protein
MFSRETNLASPSLDHAHGVELEIDGVVHVLVVAVPASEVDDGFGPGIREIAIPADELTDRRGGSPRCSDVVEKI